MYVQFSDIGMCGMYNSDILHCTDYGIQIDGHEI